MTPVNLRTLLAAPAVVGSLLCLIALAMLSSATDAGAAGFLDNSAPKKVERPTYAAPAARKPIEGEGSDALEGALYNANLRVQESRQNYETALYSYKRARTSNYPRGAALEKIRVRLADMEKERDAAENDFLAAYDAARRGEVPAGVLMSYDELEEEILRGR
jgi:hypothetical protein